MLERSGDDLLRPEVVVVELLARPFVADLLRRCEEDVPGHDDKWKPFNEQHAPVAAAGMRALRVVIGIDSDKYAGFPDREVFCARCLYNWHPPFGFVK